MKRKHLNPKGIVIILTVMTLFSAGCIKEKQSDLSGKEQDNLIVDSSDDSVDNSEEEESSLTEPQESEPAEDIAVEDITDEEVDGDDSQTLDDYVVELQEDETFEID